MLVPTAIRSIEYRRTFLGFVTLRATSRSFSLAIKD